MKTGRGIVLSQSEVLTEFGCRIKYSNKLKKGTKIWMHYDNGGKLVSIEPQVQNPSFEQFKDYSNWGGE